MTSLIEDSLTTLTDLHRKCSRLIERWHVAILEEVDFPPFVVDIYLPDYHVAVEVDGPQHSPGRDAKRDTVLLRTYELPTLRVTAADIDNRDRLFKMLDAFLVEWALSSDARWERTKDKTPWL